MKQNKYDDPDFFESYSTMARSQEGLKAAGEWPMFREMLPPLKSKRILDLGCVMDGIVSMRPNKVQATL